MDNLFDPSSPRHRSSPNIGANNNNSTNNNNNNSTSATSTSINSNNTPQLTTPGEDEEVFTVNSSSTHVPSDKHKNDTDNTKDPYLVDVDVDVDGVMMDGLDQVEYMNRTSGNTSGNRFYSEDDDVLDNGDEYGADGARFTTEPISRTLEALALEGLTEF